MKGCGSMNIYPNEYQNLKLERNEKMFIRYVESCAEDGYLFLNTNPAMQDGQISHILVTKNGVLILYFIDASDASAVVPSLTPLHEYVYKQSLDFICKRLFGNKALVGNDSKLRFLLNYCYVFPLINRSEIDTKSCNNEMKVFIKESCLFREDFSKFKTSLIEVTDLFLKYKLSNISSDKLLIDDKSINSILQRLAPEYTIIRNAVVVDKETYKGADNELLIVTEDDSVIKAFRLDNDQINIVNKISKGEQLILACAGSGKSVLLIAKCFKAAQMNPNKKFLITCKSKKLQSLYTMFIDRAGLKERNVECKTFHKLCQDLLMANGLPVPYDIEDFPDATIKAFDNEKIKNRYYGVFIDEIQEFEQEWYKLCFNMLENKKSDDHLFVICGDKTQKISKAQRRGQAPWNCGEEYPNYRGGHKSIRIEKNYRNCIEINDFINKYVVKARDVLLNLPGDNEIDPDLFLRGKSIRNGIGTFFIDLKKKTSLEEAQQVYDCIKEAHDIHKIPYDEIAIVMYNKQYSKKMKDWDEPSYNLREKLTSKLSYNNIDYFDLYEDTNFSTSDGVTLVSFQSALGLDFRAVIVCGFAPFGHYSQTKYLDPNRISLMTDEEQIDSLKKEINQLYVACTRARDVLYIVQPERNTLFMKMLRDAYEEK